MSELRMWIIGRDYEILAGPDLNFNEFEAILIEKSAYDTLRADQAALLAEADEVAKLLPFCICAVAEDRPGVYEHSLACTRIRNGIERYARFREGK